MRANQLRLWLASFAYVLLCAVRRVGLAHTQFASRPRPRARTRTFVGALIVWCWTVFGGLDGDRRGIRARRLDQPVDGARALWLLPLGLVQRPRGARPMKTEIAVAAGMLVLALSAPAAASPREYNRGYYDCSNGQLTKMRRAAPTGRAAGTRSANRGPSRATPVPRGRDGVTTATGRARGAGDPDGARTAADGTAASRGLRARRAFPTFRA